jgi:hypothetical protein
MQVRAPGGIRLSQHAVPTATNTGVNSQQPGTKGFCSTYGSYQPFDAATLSALYLNHGTYVSKVTQVTHGNLNNGFIVLEDVIATVRDVAHSDIGKR